MTTIIYAIVAIVIGWFIADTIPNVLKLSGILASILKLVGAVFEIVGVVVLILGVLALFGVNVVDLSNPIGALFSLFH